MLYVFLLACMWQEKHAWIRGTYENSNIVLCYCWLTIFHLLQGLKTTKSMIITITITDTGTAVAGTIPPILSLHR